MEIHKPKPWHGLREFLKEYLIIVVGVLTALAAEAGVEWLHWREKVDAGEAQIRRELSYSWDYAHERVLVTPCLQRRLALLQRSLLEPATAWAPLPPMVHATLGPAVMVTPGRSWNMEVWASLTADGTIGHFERNRQVRLGRIYNQVARLDQLNRAEKDDIGELELLSEPMDLDHAQRLTFARVVARERTRVRDLGFISNQLYRGLPSLIRPTGETTNTVLAESNTIKACRAAGLLDQTAR